MNVFGLPACCPDCGGELKLINGTSSGSLAVAILSCKCGLEWCVTARVTPMRSAKLQQARIVKARSSAKAKAA